MIMMVYSQKSLPPNISAGSVLVQNYFYEVKSGQIFAKFHIFTQTFWNLSYGF